MLNLHRKSIMIPIRCFTCGKIIAHKWEEYKGHLESGLSKADALDMISMDRYCCRRMFLGHVNVTDKLLLYPDDIDDQFEEKSGKNSSM